MARLSSLAIGGCGDGDETVRYCAYWDESNPNEGGSRQNILAVETDSYEKARDILLSFVQVTEAVIGRGRCYQQDLRCGDSDEPVCGIIDEPLTYPNLCQFKQEVVRRASTYADAVGAWKAGACDPSGYALPVLPAAIPQCGPGERLCQTSINNYICVPFDEPCPEPDDDDDPPMPQCK